MTIRNLFPILMVSLICPAVASAQNQNQPEPTSRMTLFDRGDLQSKYWRIPAITVAPDGTVIAVADKRNDSNWDLPNIIDVAMRRSHDNGVTWEDARVIMPSDAGGGYGDPAIAVHKPTGDIVVVAAHGAGLWDATPEKHQHLAVIRSSDNGVTWTEPVDITAMLYDPQPGVAPIQAVAGFATSGTMLCDDKGNLMFVLVAKNTEEKSGRLYCYVAYSEDGGYTWKLNPNVVDMNGDESKIAQLPDGSYYMSIRDRNKNSRKYSRTDDFKGHWTAPMANPQLIDPACNGDVIVLTPEQVDQLGISEIIGADAAKNGLMVHSLAYDPQKRKNVSVLVSSDQGVNWTPIYNITPDGSAYSAIVMLPNGELACFSEEDREDDGYKLCFTSFDLAAAIAAAMAE